MSDADERRLNAEQRKREREAVRDSIEGDAEADYIAWADAEHLRWLEYWHSLTNEERAEERRMMDAHAAEQDERQRAETSRGRLPNGYAEPLCDQ